MCSCPGFLGLLLQSISSSKARFASSSLSTKAMSIIIGSYASAQDQSRPSRFISVENSSCSLKECGQVPRSTELAADLAYMVLQRPPGRSVLFDRFRWAYTIQIIYLESRMYEPHPSQASSHPSRTVPSSPCLPSFDPSQTFSTTPAIFSKAFIRHRRFVHSILSFVVDVFDHLPLTIPKLPAHYS